MTSDKSYFLVGLTPDQVQRLANTAPSRILDGGMAKAFDWCISDIIVDSIEYFDTEKALIEYIRRLT